MNLPDAEAANRALQPDALAGVARAWGFETVSPVRRLGGYSSLNLLVSADQRQLVLKRTSQAQEASLARADAFVRDLPAASLPPPGRIPSRDGARSWRRGLQVFSLTAFVDGAVRHADGLDDAALTEIAAAARALHSAPRGAAPPPSSLDEMFPPEEAAAARLEAARELCRAAKPDVAAPVLELLRVKDELRRRLDREGLVGRLAARDDLVHGDFHNENLLFSAEGALTAVLDYEYAHRGGRAEDLATFVSLAFLGSGQVDRARDFIQAYGGIDQAEMEDGFLAYLYRKGSNAVVELGALERPDAIEMLIVRRDTAALPGLWDRYVELSGYLTDAGIA